MLDLDRARAIAADLADGSPVAVSGRWLRQAIREISEGREARQAALDFRPAGEVPSLEELERFTARGAFTTLVASQRRVTPAGEF